MEAKINSILNNSQAYDALADSLVSNGTISRKLRSSVNKHLQTLSESELDEIMDSLNVTVEESTASESAILTNLSGVETIAVGDAQVAVVRGTILKTSTGNVQVQCDNKIILVRNTDFMQLVDEGVLAIGTEVVIKADTISAIATLPGYYQGQVMVSQIPQLVELAEYRKTQKKAAILYRKELRSVGLSTEQVNQKLADRVDSEFAFPKRPSFGK